MKEMKYKNLNYTVINFNKKYVKFYVTLLFLFIFLTIEHYEALCSKIAHRNDVHNLKFK